MIDAVAEIERIDALEHHVQLLTENLKTMQAAMIALVQQMQAQTKPAVTIIDRFGERLN